MSEKEYGYSPQGYQQQASWDAVNQNPAGPSWDSIPSPQYQPIPKRSPPKGLIAVATIIFVSLFALVLMFLVGQRQEQAEYQAFVDGLDNSPMTDEIAYGYTNTGVSINQTAGECTTNSVAVANAYPMLTFTNGSGGTFGGDSRLHESSVGQNLRFISKLLEFLKVRSGPGRPHPVVSSPRHKNKRPKVRHEQGKKQKSPRSIEQDSRVVNGVKTDIREFPWQVSLWYVYEGFDGELYGGHICGGSILLEDWAITAAHCTDDGFDDEQDRYLPKDYQNYRVYVGVQQTNEAYENNVFSELDWIYQHEMYSLPSNLHNDISLLKMTDKVVFSESIQPICLPRMDTTPYIDDVENQEGNITCFSSGYGAVYSSGTFQDHVGSNWLLSYTAPLIESEACNNMMGVDGWVTDDMICQGFQEGGTDSCQGDSGGPMVCVKDSASAAEHHNQTWYLTGVVSWGLGCAEPNRPGVYARVIRYYDWIWETIANDLADKE